MLLPAPNPTIVGFKRMAVSSSVAAFSAKPVKAWTGPIRPLDQVQRGLVSPARRHRPCFVVRSPARSRRPSAAIWLHILLEGMKCLVRDLWLEEASRFKSAELEGWILVGDVLL